MIRTFEKQDAKQVAAIYNYYVENSAATFDCHPVSTEKMLLKAENIMAKGYPFVVYEDNGIIGGYACLSDWRPQEAYLITLETTVYLLPDYVGKGVGSELYRYIIDAATDLGVHSLIGVLSLPNEASRRLNMKFGFRLAGTFPETGLKFGRLIDVEFWQKII